jgi:hypothetical protein
MDWWTTTNNRFHRQGRILVQQQRIVMAAAAGSQSGIVQRGSISSILRAGILFPRNGILLVHCRAVRNFTSYHTLERYRGWHAFASRHQSQWGQKDYYVLVPKDFLDFISFFQDISKK